MRPHDTIGSPTSLIVNPAILVGAHHAFVGKRPKKTTGTTGIFAHHFPIIPETCTMTAIVQTVQKFGRHKDFRLAHILLTFTIRTIVHGFKSAEVSLWMEHRTFLRVKRRKLTIQVKVETAFVTVRPPSNTWMIEVAGNHFIDQLFTDSSVVFAMPAAQFHHHIQTQFVAGIQKFGIGRIVRQAYCVHIHFFDELYILKVVFF